MSGSIDGYNIFFPQYKKGKQGLQIFPGTILEHARKLGIEVASECGGQGICGRCVVRIDQGAEALNPPTAAEEAFGLGKNQRLAAIAEQVKVLATEVSQQSENNQQAALLRTIPGVGPLLSVAMVAEIGDIRRFPSAAQLRSYSGLVPRVSQSGERCWTGPLTKRGVRFLRWAMVLAAQHFSRVKATKNMRTHSGVCSLIVKKAPINSKTYP